MFEIILGILIGHILMETYLIKRKKEFAIEKWIKSKIEQVILLCQKKKLKK